METHWSQSCVSFEVSQGWDGVEENDDPIQVGQGLQKEHTEQSSGGGGDSGGGGGDGTWGCRLETGRGRRIRS